MSRLEGRLKALKETGKPALIVYITGGCPDMGVTLQAIKAAEQAGADVIEIGVPFSDPMADGPVIQLASSMALKAGTTMKSIMGLVRSVRTFSQIPIALMTYINPVLGYGPGAFVQAAREAGVDGLIIPDLPLEESHLLAETCRQGGVNLIQFIAPTTTPERVEVICREASGFIYCISNTGVTGAREVDYSQLAPTIELARKYTNVPLAIGFGIGSPSAAKEAAKYADGVIVGSAVMDRIMNGGVDVMSELISAMRRSLDEK